MAACRLRPELKSMLRTSDFDAWCCTSSVACNALNEYDRRVLFTWRGASRIFPRCCDGRPSEPLDTAPEHKPPVEDESTHSSGVAHAFLVGLLVVSGSIGWWLYLRPAAELDATRLVGMPMQIGEWGGRDIPISEGVEAILRADAHVQREYRDREGEIVWVYVGYYGTQRGGRPEHTPWACYPSAGWSIERVEEVHDSPSESTEGNLVSNELLVEKDGERRLVRFWYSTHRSRSIATETSLTLDHLAGRFSSTGRADGALVRISTPIGPRGLSRARDRLIRFAGPLTDEVRIYWPRSAEALGAPPTTW